MSAAQQARNKALHERITTLEAALEIVQEELRTATRRAESAETECERLRMIVTCARELIEYDRDRGAAERGFPEWDRLFDALGAALRRKE